MLLPEHLYHRADDVISRDDLLSTCRLDRVVSPVFFPGTIKHIRDVLRKTT